MQTDVKTARTAKKWEQQTLAQRSGVSQATISRIESGDITNPSYDTVVALEDALALKRGSLVFGQTMRASA